MLTSSLVQEQMSGYIPAEPPLVSPVSPTFLHRLPSPISSTLEFPLLRHLGRNNDDSDCKLNMDQKWTPFHQRLVWPRCRPLCCNMQSMWQMAILACVCVSHEFSLGQTSSECSVWLSDCTCRGPGGGVVPWLQIENPKYWLWKGQINEL